MGCGGSKEAAPNPEADSRREKQAEKRRKSQEKLRPEDEEQQKQLVAKFNQEIEGTWPVRPPWHIKGKHTQGLGILIVMPPPEDATLETYFTLVVRNKDNYSIDVGFGAETKFESNTARFDIKCSTVSSNHCKLHFSRTDGRSTVEIEDTNSLNGTFVLGRPGPENEDRVLMELEIRNRRMSLEGIEYVRLGHACVLALDSTNIFWDDERDDDEDDNTEVGLPSKQELLDGGWYFPMPCPPRLLEMTQKKREAAPQAAKKVGAGAVV
eukprot:c32763_g1_i1.p1 GENE.c32763_g1_i1~~c32763_g1_i1.p1  ORF type:complete len:267 (+),score=56.37 c32763_g1_i1:55-855(+)